MLVDQRRIHFEIIADRLTKMKFSIPYAVSFNIFALHLNTCIIGEKEEN